MAGATPATAADRRREGWQFAHAAFTNMVIEVAGKIGGTVTSSGQVIALGRAMAGGCGIVLVSV